MTFFVSTTCSCSFRSGCGGLRKVWESRSPLDACYFPSLWYVEALGCEMHLQCIDFLLSTLLSTFKFCQVSIRVCQVSFQGVKFQLEVVKFHIGINFGESKNLIPSIISGRPYRNKILPPKLGGRTDECYLVQPSIIHQHFDEMTHTLLSHY